MRNLLSTVLLMSALVLFVGCESQPETDTAAPDTATTSEIDPSIPTDTHADTTGFEPLFTNDLSGAVLEEPNSWEFSEGVLKANDHSTIWTDESYGDFVLDFEFKVPEQGNSGVFIRTADRNDILSALEIQIHETTDGTPHGQVGAVYDLLSPSVEAGKPAGEWNRYTITATGNRLFVVLNGQQVIDMDLDEWTTPRQNPDGSPNKFSRAIRDQARSGPIGLQGIHGPTGESVEFRNLKIRPL